MRRLVLTDEILELPALTRDLAEAYGRAEQRLGILEQRMIELAEAQARTAERLGVLEQRMIELAEAQARTERRVNDLVEAQARTERRVNDLVEAQTRTEGRVNDLVEVVARLETTLGIVADRQNQMRGDWLAQRYSDRAASYFGRQLRRLRVVLPGRAIDRATEDRLEAQLTGDELNEIFWLDVLAHGRLRHAADAEPDVWLAVEVSGVIDRGDVERAERRAALLRKAGLRALPVVAGEGVTQGATALLRDTPVVLVLDGRSEGWERALSHYS
jgi:hypothetical protein